MKFGTVYIVGAGPGDPGLITVKAINRVKNADVVVYDRLVNDSLLCYCKNNCEQIYVGKQSGFHCIKQEEITKILIKKAKIGLNVVRLKGGNPFIFARGSEEAIALRKEGIEFEIIPGITSGTAAPIYSGIPITQRGLVTQCVFLTAHECPEKDGTQVEWKKLAQLKNTTFMIYMGASRIEAISKTMIKYGLDSKTPVAVIENGTLSKQRTLTSTIDNVHIEFHRLGFHAPAIIMISPTVNFRKDIAWWEKLPLYSKKIIITEPYNHSEKLYSSLYNLGAEIVHLPLVRTERNKPSKGVKALFKNLNFDWLLFSCGTEVDYFFEQLLSEDLDSRILANTKIAAIGSNAKEKLKHYGIIPDYFADNFAPASFTNDFIESVIINESNFLRIANNEKKDPISEILLGLGANIESMELFRNVYQKPAQDMVDNLISEGADIFIFSDSSIVNHYFEILGNETATEILSKCKSVLVDTEPIEILTKKNIQNVVVHSNYSVKGISEVITTQT